MFIVYKLYVHECDNYEYMTNKKHKKDKKDKKHHKHVEHMQNTATNNEALCDTVSVYNPNNFYMTNATFQTLSIGSGGSFNLLPKGIIFAFNGTTIPAGWAICDGTNGTPDLRSKFIMGSDTTGTGQTGGAPNVTLTVDNLPAHTHTYSVDNGTGQALTGVALVVKNKESYYTSLTATNTTVAGGVSTYKPPTTTTTNTKTASNITTSLATTKPATTAVNTAKLPTITNTTGTTNIASIATLAAGVAAYNVADFASTPISMMPPYYALVYIMKL